MALFKKKFDGYSIEETQDGPGGSVFYIEQGGRLPFDWEYAPDGVCVRVPPPREWDAFCEVHTASWAEGRRDEILTRIGDFYVRWLSNGLLSRLFRIKAAYNVEDYMLTIRRL